MKKKSLILGALLIVALAGGVMLIQQNQENRSSASFANTTLSLLPAEKISKKIGNEFTVSVNYSSPAGVKLDNIEALMCYGPNIELETSLATGNDQMGFDTPMLLPQTKSGNDNCVKVVVLKKTNALDKVSNAGQAATLKFKAISNGSGSIYFNKDKSFATGENLNSTDKKIAVTVVAGTTYEISATGVTVTSTAIPTQPKAAATATAIPTQPSVVDGAAPILNYKVSFAYVKGNDSACVVNWPLQIIVLSAGESKVYSNVIPQSKTVVGNKAVFQGSLSLTGFNHTTGVAVFVKGPKHLQMKYAMANQDKYYGKAGGELTLTKVASTSPVYDFTGYPMIPGDVAGANTESQDGWISGVDYSMVKTKAATHETVDAGGYIKEDLDGNCQVNSNDVNVLKISLEAKQGELY